MSSPLDMTRRPRPPSTAPATPSRLSVAIQAPLSSSKRAMPYLDAADENGSSSSSTAAAAAAAATPTASQRGRPRGWKPGMSYSELRGRPPPPARAERAARPAPGQMVMRGRRGGGRRAGRRLSSPTPREVYRRMREAPFIPYTCEWQGCKAELHNLGTLRRHVKVVHVDRSSDGRCLWGRRCAAAAAAPAATAASAAAPGGAGLAGHVEDRHMVPYAWHVGDGPRNDSLHGKSGGRRRSEGTVDVDESIPHYLKDAEGNQVTPSVRDQEVEDYATWRSNRRKLREMLIERDRNLPSESEDDEEAPE